MRKIIMLSLLLAASRLFCQESYSIEDMQHFFTRGGLIYDIVDKTNAIKTKTDTLKISLSQANVDESQTITLGTTGTYILMDNIIGNIAITGTNVTLDLSGKSLIGTVNVTGSVTIIKNGAIVAPPPVTMEMAAVPALVIDAAASMVRIKECHIECLSSVQVDPVADLAIPGRHAVQISGFIVDMYGCSIGAGSAVNTVNAAGPDGGTAIIIDGTAKKVRIGDTIMVAGDAGSAQENAGGNGGHGIHIKDTVNQIEVKNCTVFETGNGGVPGGNGGHGISIESGVADACIYDCHIRNTGTGDGPGAGGKAVQDAVTSVGNYSIVYRNVAHNIANSLKFDLQDAGIEKGILSPTPPDNVQINMFGNIYFS